MEDIKYTKQLLDHRLIGRTTPVPPLETTRWAEVAQSV